MHITNLGNTPGCKPGFLIIGERSKTISGGVTIAKMNHLQGSSSQFFTYMSRASVIACPRPKTELNSVFVACSKGSPPVTITIETQLIYFDNSQSSEDEVKVDVIAYVNPHDIESALDAPTSETIILK